jgi:DNA adenine methylase
MQDGLVSKVILVDRDPWIASFWHTVFFDTDWLVQQVETMEVTLEKWQQFKQSTPTTIRDQALTGFYLNRTSFSGILEAKAGPLGGKSQKSDYKIDCRFPRETLVRRIEQAAAHRKKVHAVWNCSWEAGVAKIRDAQQAGNLPTQDVFFYFDPPFFEKAEDLYRFYFVEDDHKALRDFLLRLEDKWILSYDSADQVEALYGKALRHGTNGTQKDHVELFYSLAVMSKRSKKKEVIISNLERLPSPDSN